MRRRRPLSVEIRLPDAVPVDRPARRDAAQHGEGRGRALPGVRAEPDEHAGGGAEDGSGQAGLVVGFPGVLWVGAGAGGPDVARGLWVAELEEGVVEGARDFERAGGGLDFVVRIGGVPGVGDAFVGMGGG